MILFGDWVGDVGDDVSDGGGVLDEVVFLRRVVATLVD